MCGWGAGGESGPGSGCGMGRHGGVAQGTALEGGGQGNAPAGQEGPCGTGLGWVEGESHGHSHRCSLRGGCRV